MKLVAIVGSGSGCGKTTLACRILLAVPGLGAVKISPREGPSRVEWGAGSPGKDTDLYVRSGAAPVARIVGPRDRVVEVWEGIRDAFAGCRAVLIEGSRALDVPADRFVVFVGAPGWRRSRPRRNRQLASLADLVVERSGRGGGADPVAPVRRFLAAPPGETTPASRTRGVASLVLASSSPRRRRLLRSLGVAFTVRVPDVDERPLPGERPAAHVRRLALAKARAAARGLDPDSGARWVLGADTVVVLDAEILGKPRDARHARALLRKLAGRTHEVLTGIALVPVPGPVPAARRARTAVVRTRVTMKPFDEAAIERYVAGGEPLDKAGAYAVQGRGRRLVVAVAGSLTNVVGLPLERLEKLLAECGIAAAPRRS